MAQVEYINPYATVSQGGAVSRLWLPILCVAVIMTAAVVGFYAVWHDARRQAGIDVQAAVAAAPIKTPTTPGPTVYDVNGRQQIEEENHDFCDYKGKGLEAQDGVVAVVERYWCAGTLQKMRMNPHPELMKH